MVKTNKKTIAPDERLRQFTRRIEESGHGRFRSYDTFRWLLVANLARFSVPLAETVPDDAAPLVEDLVNAFHELVGDHPPFTDLLGPVYMELAAHGSKSILGQYFSPQTISAFMGEVLVADNDPPKDRLITACDPTAGSGVMMLSWCQTMLRHHGKNALRDCSVTCVDIDLYCAYMCAVQFLMAVHTHGLTLGEILVVHGNSLLPADIYRVVVHATRADLPHELIAPADHPVRWEAIRRAAVQSNIGGQLSLFAPESDGQEPEAA
jgi:hypothetical protein